MHFPLRPRSARRAPLLAGMLMTLQVLGGLVVCVGGSGVSAAWGGGSECARRVALTSGRAEVATSPDALQCVALSQEEARVAAPGTEAVPSEPATGWMVFSAPDPEVVPAQIGVSHQMRGPPRAVPFSVRSVVLRI